MAYSSRKTLFNEQWVDPQLYPEFAGWLKGLSGDKTKAFCAICRKSFALSNMGREAVNSHARGTTHQKVKELKKSQPSLQSFF